MRSEGGTGVVAGIAVAVNTADTYVADQMRTLAQAFKIQAEIIKKNKKKKKK